MSNLIDNLTTPTDNSEISSSDITLDDLKQQLSTCTPTTLPSFTSTITSIVSSSPPPSPDVLQWCIIHLLQHSSTPHTLYPTIKALGYAYTLAPNLLRSISSPLKTDDARRACKRYVRVYDDFLPDDTLAAFQMAFDER